MKCVQLNSRISDTRIRSSGKVAAQLVEEYGSSFAEQNLRRMVQFAATFPDE
ncbi:DUF1016 domain-containing protein, partial [Xylella fastidiosa subsp. multiplex]|nr:DUF1016 domain-containing protein [Xylella fastidiosa subsp. multiplex]